MEEDRDEAWDTWINLERIYTVREIKARFGYILHDLHNDDIPVEIVTFSSSEAGGRGNVIGTYPGNKAEEKEEPFSLAPARHRAPPSEIQEAKEGPGISVHEVPVVQAAATPSNAENLRKRSRRKNLRMRRYWTKMRISMRNWRMT